MKKLLFSILLVLLPTLAIADITWQFDELRGTLTISGTGPMDNYYNNSTTAPWREYYGRIIRVIIENGITSIGDFAFYGCSSMISVTIPNSVTSIGNSAYFGCSRLISVTINSNTILSKNYSSSSSLKDIFGHQVEIYTIGAEVTSIGDYAFYGCSGITSVTIPNSVASIGGSAFSGCRSLTSVTIGNSVTTIGNSAFNGCYRLNTIYCLNPTPPTCSLNTFYCEKNVRDRYDIYTYAILRVPMGSEEVYGAAYEWRYFNKKKGGHGVWW